MVLSLLQQSLPVTSGEKGYGAILPKLIEKIQKNGINEIEGIIADTAYGTKDNIETCKSKSIKLVAPLPPSVNGFRDKKMVLSIIRTHRT